MSGIDLWWSNYLGLCVVSISLKEVFCYHLNIHNLHVHVNAQAHFGQIVTCNLIRPAHVLEECITCKSPAA